jgi:hypothetical protein
VGPAPRDDAFGLASTLLLDHVAVTVISRLAEAGVRAILLKGASFRDLFFDAGELRSYTDVDLLIAPVDLAPAGRVLAELGYEDIFAGAAPSETSPFATEFRGTRAYIDVHRSLPGVTVPEAEAWAELSARTQTITLEGAAVEVLDAGGRCLHAALNAASDGRARSRQDLLRAVDRVPRATWRGVVDLAERLGATPSLVAGLALVPEAEELRRWLELDVDVPVGVALRTQSPPPLAIGLHRLVTTPGWRGKVAFLARRVFPTPSGLRYWSPLARRGGTVGMVLAYAWRPFHLILRAPAAVGAVVRAWRQRRSGAWRLPPAP